MGWIFPWLLGLHQAFLTAGFLGLVFRLSPGRGPKGTGRGGLRNILGTTASLSQVPAMLLVLDCSRDPCVNLEDFPVSASSATVRFCCFRLFVTLWTSAHQAPLSMGFLRQEYMNGLPFCSPVDLPGPGTEPASPALAGRFFTTEPPGEPTSVPRLVTISFC